MDLYLNGEYSGLYLLTEKVEVHRNRLLIDTDSGDFLNRFGYAHIAFSVGSKDAVDSLTQRMKEDGYPAISGPRTTGDGYYESCILGFEGNLIEITV